MKFKEIGWKSVDWMQLAQKKDHWRAIVYMAMKLLVS
jgi:hypothetical protein